MAKYIVAKCVKDNCPVNNLQLQKILFCVQKEFLQQGYGAAFHDDIEAWQFGPVVPEVYYYFCGFGAMPITPCDISVNQEYVFSTSPRLIAILDGIIEKRRSLSPWDFDEIYSHKGAWYKIYDNGAGNRKVIPTDLIKSAGENVTNTTPYKETNLMKKKKSVYLRCECDAEVLAFNMYGYNDGEVGFEINIEDSYCGGDFMGIKGRFKRAWKAFFARPICYTGIYVKKVEQVQKFLEECLHVAEEEATIRG